MSSSFKQSILLSASSLTMALASSPAFAQPAESAGESMIIVTGSRIERPNLEANSPIAVVTGEETTRHADITLETFLNTLPQVNPAGTTTSNNPPNDGQANIDLRGLGNNRNLVLIDGRRPMASAVDQTVDLNTIPQALIKRVEVVTGGAGATYGADAVAGVVNFIMKDDFHGIELEGTYANSISETDAREYRLAATGGLNFGPDDRGNIAVSFEYARRQGLIKRQRSFASQATSTTPTPPTGRFQDAARTTSLDAMGNVVVTNPGNVLDQTAINSLFLSRYGVPIGAAGAASQLGFNSDGTLFGGGTFATPINATNYRYDPLGNDGAGANQNFFPDFYSYNFDAINLLVLPLKRKSVFGTAHYDFDEAIEVYAQGGWTKYDSATALAPTPLGVSIRAPDSTSPSTNARSPLLSPRGSCFTNTLAVTDCAATGLIIPTTNPFIPADLRTLLNSRTGNDNRFVGSGATEPFNLAYRFLPTGLRQQSFDNEVKQGLLGFRGHITDKWRYDVFYSYGKTDIVQGAASNIDVQKVQQLLEAPDGGNSLCAGGFNPFGVQPLSQACIDFVRVDATVKTTFTQKILSGYVAGDLFELPAGPISIVLGAETRKFDFQLDPGSLNGPIAGFNTQQPIDASNKFFDYFAEALIPIVKDASWAQVLELSLGYRHSRANANDKANGIDPPSNGSDAYKAELNWQPTDNLRFRGSYQRAVRAPNIDELFNAGGSFPQIFDPCSINTNFRASSGAAGRALCAAQVGGSAVDTFVALPGTQGALGGAANPFLKPEKADTFTGGVVFQYGRLVGSLDYYNIKVRNLIRIPDVNLFIASCFNYVGNANPTLSASNPYCGSIVRSGGNISFAAAPPSLGGDANNNFIAINRGSIKTSGIDMQLAYKLPTDFVKEESGLAFNLLVSYLIDFKEQEIPGVTIDYAGTAGYFGEGLSASGGATHPEWKATLDTAFTIGKFTISNRLRYTDGMSNRILKQFAGEAATGPKSVIYVDLAGEVKIDGLTLRAGVNNVFDKQPPQYSPNVQSGTDPALYDVIGRRAYVGARVKF